MKGATYLIYFFPFFKTILTWMVSFLICWAVMKLNLPRSLGSVLPRVQVPVFPIM